MICVECSDPGIECLYSEFKSNYIKLTVCPKCGNLADKYIEFDNVILFLDVLLLKPQAYRHVAFNVVEEAIFKTFKSSDRFLVRYRMIVRYVVLCILFEVYLKWAYEEKAASHSMLKAAVLLAPVPLQYGFFICQQLVEKITLCGLVNVLFINLLGFGLETNKNLDQSYQRSYFSCVLLVTIFMSLAVKCLPIIMLIWPYDNANTASTVVEILGVFNTIEALKMNTNHSYLATCCVVTFSTLLLIIAREVFMCYLVGNISNGASITELLKDEHQQLMLEVNNFLSLCRTSLGDLFIET